MPIKAFDRLKRWVEWWKTITAVAAVLFFALAFTRTIYSQWIFTLQAVEEHEARISRMEKEVGPALQRIMNKLESMDRRSRTMVGVAAAALFGSDESSFQINTLSPAILYKDLLRARITNLSSPNQPALVLKIDGTFTNDDERFLIRVSRKAADALEIHADMRVKVRLEPHELPQ